MEVVMVTAGYTVALSGFNIPVWRNTALFPPK